VIPGACVFYRAEGWSEDVQVRGGETNEAGIYVVKNLSPGGTYRVTVWAAGYQPSEVNGIVPQMKQPQVINVQLEPGGQRFVGRVVDEETGKPLSQARVFIGQALHDPMTRWRGFFGFNRLFARCDQDGRYQLPCPEPGSYYLVAYADGYDQVEAACAVEPDVPAVTVPDLQMKRSRFGVLHLTVLAPDGTTPVEGAEVYLDTGPLPKGGATTAADGTLVLERVNVNWPPVHFLTVWREGYAITVADKVRVTEGQTTSLEIRLISGVALAGQVLDQHGQPVSDRVVTAKPIALRIRDQFWPVWPQERLLLTTDVDKEGRFHIPHLAPGLWSVTSSDKEGVMKGSSQTVTVAADVKEVMVNLQEVR